MKQLDKLFHFLPKFLQSLSLSLLALILVTVFLQVVFRYVLGLSVPWTEEAARYFNVWMVFLGCAAAVAREDHIGVTFFIERIVKRVRDAVLLFIFLIMATFDVILFFGSIHLTRLNWNQQATTLPVPVSTLYIAIIVSSFFSLLFLAYLIRNKVTDLFATKE